MKKIAVYIATTNGPVQIELISEESIPRSEVVLSGDFIPLDNMSNEYHHFVSGSGPVSRAFGPFTEKSFHMELSSPIDSGRSWHLAALIAHGLELKGQLATPETTPDQIILATGRLGHNFELEADHLEKKLNLSQDLLRTANEKGIPVLIAGPVGMKISDPSYLNMTSSEAKDGYVILDELGIAYNQTMTSTNSISVMESPASNLKKTYWKLTVTVAVTAACIFLATEFDLFKLTLFQTDSKTSVKKIELNKTQREQSKLKVEKTKSPIPELISIHGIRPPSGRSCAEIHFKKISGELFTINKSSASSLEPIQNTNLCGITIKRKSNSIISKITLSIVSGKFVNLDKQRTDIKNFDLDNFYLYTPHFFKIPIAYTIFVETKAGVSNTISHTILP